jgi:hypothetical protein
MSGFLITGNQDAERNFVARRGPDLTSGVRGRFSHYLLNVAGKRAPSPFVSMAGAQRRSDGSGYINNQFRSMDDFPQNAAF